ncbi:phosphofurin acidic cluster sorting protein 2-like isoform X3 [Hydractinia symbiolongicarpus]|uniref:phosphofurin acidic cluster sorting protein 2-like isoform X3 n=1 Tax=Hydractinia symbiolongicarpus TaxID=13093 RepID=UPI00254B9971|nr:phosphofurin acidic cluster sorting protein 2-like isoform X3 [Hydractinia symbiolongicarpus]
MAKMAAMSGGKSKVTDSAWAKPETMQQQVNFNRPIKSMKLFTEWDVENAAPNCIPRSCCLRVIRLQVFRALEQDLKALVVCVAMQGSRRSLRSDQIPVQPSGSLDVDLDLVFTLQYPHFLKRRENRLQITLQRRKKYKTRTILGYKTLAVGHINMAQILQGWYSPHLHLYTKDGTSPAATLSIASVSSEPVERDLNVRRHPIASMAEPSSDEEGDDDSYSSDVEDSAGEMDSARETYSRHTSRHRKVSSRNFKQKIIQALFKKLKVTDADLGHVHEGLARELNKVDMDNEEFLFDDDDDDDDDDDSDVDSNILEDNASIASAQKPGLRPYFDHSRSQTTLNQNTLTRSEAQELSVALGCVLNGIDSNRDGVNNDTSQQEKPNAESIFHDSDTQAELKDDRVPSPDRLKTGPRSISFKEKGGDKIHLQRKRSVDLEKICKESAKTDFTDQLSTILGNDGKIPEYILLVGIKDDISQHLTLKRISRLGPVICTSCSSDVQATITAVSNKLQKFSSRHSAPPPSIRIGVIGPESYLRNVMRSYVEQFSHKPQEYQSFVKFLVIPSGPHKVAIYLSQLDQKYSSLFMDTFWKTVFEQKFLSDTDLREVEKRILYYVQHSDSIHSIPIAEALITSRLLNGESAQRFIPFIMEVRMGLNESFYNADGTDSDTGSPSNSNMSKENNGNSSDKSCKDALSSSPRNELDNRSVHGQSSTSETLDLVVDYWPIPSLQYQNRKEERKDNKLSIKSTFRSLCVSRLPSNENEDNNGLLFSANTKNRNKGVKRLMKQRDKDTESKSAVSTIVGKLVCTARSSGQTFSVWIDGKEWNNVKFFSLSSQWPTHIKQFPIGMFLNYGISEWS